MGVIEDLLSGFGGIFSGIINTILALVNGVVQLAETIIFGIITLATSVFHALFSLLGNMFTFVVANIAIIVLAGIGYFVYTTYVAPQQSRRAGKKKWT